MSSSWFANITVPLKDMLSQENKDNLKKLADYLAAGNLAYGFSMEAYAKHGTNAVTGNDPARVGDTGCAAGHGPAAGLPIQEGEAWGKYAYRCFGGTSDLVGWCFSAKWAKTDNTPEGAAARIRWVLRHGEIPADGLQQCYGTAPLCYRNAEGGIIDV